MSFFVTVRTLLMFCILEVGAGWGDLNPEEEFIVIDCTFVCLTSLLFSMWK